MCVGASMPANKVFMLACSKVGTLLESFSSAVPLVQQRRASLFFIVAIYVFLQLHH